MRLCPGRFCYQSWIPHQENVVTSWEAADHIT
jgi:hypothetical protein